MTLDELKIQVEKDLTINDERLDTESYKIKNFMQSILTTKQTLSFYSIVQRVNTKFCIVKNGNTMVVRLMQKSMQPNHLTSKFSKTIYTYT